MDTYPEKPKNPVAHEESFPYAMFYWRLMLALLIPASILAALLLLPIVLINWFMG